MVYYNDAKIQLLDLPGIIEGAAQGRGRGRQVIATAKSADLIFIVLDATKDDTQKEKLEAELESVGIRLNKSPPNISLTVKKGGGIHFNSTVKCNQVDEKMVYNILKEYKIHNADVVYREDGPIDWLIDVLEGNRKYVKCLYVYNKIDMLSLKEIDALARKPMSVVVSANKEWNLDGLIERLWAELGMVRVYTKKKGAFPDLSEPLILTPQRGKCTVETAVKMLHRDLLKDVKKHAGLGHLRDALPADLLTAARFARRGRLPDPEEDGQGDLEPRRPLQQAARKNRREAENVIINSFKM